MANRYPQAIEDLLSKAIEFAWAQGRIKIDELWLRINKDRQFAEALNKYQKVEPKYGPKIAFEEFIRMELRYRLRKATYSVNTRGGLRVRMRKFPSLPDTVRGNVYIALRVLTEGEIGLLQARYNKRAQTLLALVDACGFMLKCMHDAKVTNAAPVWDQIAEGFQLGLV